MGWARWLRHRRLDEADARRLIGNETLRRIEARIAESERGHSGEIRLCIESGLPNSYLQRDAPVRERALMMFAKLRVWDTEHNNGVLVYLLLAEHAIEIVVDRDVARRVPATEWTRIAGAMTEAFRAGRFDAGLLQGIDAIDAVLVRHYAVAPGTPNPNELPDAPYLA